MSKLTYYNQYFARYCKRIFFYELDLQLEGQVNSLVGYGSKCLNQLSTNNYLQDIII